MKFQVAKFKVLVLFLISCSALINANMRTQENQEGYSDYSFVANDNLPTRVIQTGCNNSPGNNQTYCITYPDTVCNGQQFTVGLSIQNNVGATASLVPFDDIVPDPLQPSASGLLIVNHTSPTSGTFVTGPGSLQNQGGKGSWFGMTIGPSGTLSMDMTIQANILGLQQYTAFIQANPALPIPVLINVITPPDAQNTTLQGCANFPVSGNIASLVSGGSGNYSFAVVGGSEFGGNVTAFNSITGDFTFTPDPGFIGAASFQFMATDIETGCQTDVESGIVTIIFVECCNLQASNTAINDCVNTPVTGNLANLITGGTGPFTFAPFGAPVGGGVMIGSSGPFTFTPTLNFSGNGGFGYQVTDSFQCTATASVGITILSPIVQNESFSDCDSSTLIGSLTGLVSSGFPPYNFALSGAPVGGNASVSPSGIFAFVPTPGFNGPGGFVFLVTDSNGCSGTGGVNVAIGSPITATAALTTCNNSLTGNLNQFATGGTPPLTFFGPVGAVSCTGGSVTINPNGSFSFTAPTGFTGPCSFVYGIVDNNECTSTGSVTITANTIPVALGASYTTCRNTSLVETLQVNGGIPPLTFIVVTPPANGTVNINPVTREFTYIPDIGFLGNDSFQYRVVDSSVPPCQSNIATINIAVVDCCPPINDPFFALVVELFNSQIPLPPT